MGLNICIEKRHRTCQETTQLFGSKTNQTDTHPFFIKSDLYLDNNCIKRKKKKIKKLRKRIERLEHEIK